MADFFWFSDSQWGRIAPLVPSNVCGMKRVDDRRMLSGIVHTLKSGGRWADCPPIYGPKKTIYNRFVRWAEHGIWQDIFAALAGAEDVLDRLVIDSSCSKVHRCAGGAKGGPLPILLVAQKVAATPSSTPSPIAKGGRSRFRS